MKTLSTLIFLLFTTGLLFGQDYSNLYKINFKARSDYSKRDAQILKCANYMLQSPLKENEANKLNAIQFIMRWMEGTPDYNFIIGPDFIELTDGRADLSGIYIASLVKATLEENTDKNYLDEINSLAKEIYLGYCSNSQNKVKNTRAVKKILKEGNW